MMPMWHHRTKEMVVRGATRDMRAVLMDAQKEREKTIKNPHSALSKPIATVRVPTRTVYSLDAQMS